MKKILFILLLVVLYNTAFSQQLLGISKDSLMIELSKKNTDYIRDYGNCVSYTTKRSTMYIYLNNDTTYKRVSAINNKDYDDFISFLKASKFEAFSTYNETSKSIELYWISANLNCVVNTYRSYNRTYITTRFLYN